MTSSKLQHLADSCDDLIYNIADADDLATMHTKIIDSVYLLKYQILTLHQATL